MLFLIFDWFSLMELLLFDDIIFVTVVEISAVEISEHLQSDYAFLWKNTGETEWRKTIPHGRSSKCLDSPSLLLI